jgi:hypothetical protein
MADEDSSFDGSIDPMVSGAEIWVSSGEEEGSVEEQVQLPSYQSSPARIPEEVKGDNKSSEWIFHQVSAYLQGRGYDVLDIPISAVKMAEQ